MKHWLIQQYIKIKNNWLRENQRSETRSSLMQRIAEANLMIMTCRLASVEDIEQFELLQSLAYDGYIAWKKSEFLYDWYHNPYCLYVVVEMNHQIVGLISGRVRYKGAHISHVMVLPTFQGRRLGTQLMCQWFRIMKYLKCPKVTLEVRESNLLAQYLYRQHGFEVVDRKMNYYHNNHETALVMQWNKGESNGI